MFSFHKCILLGENIYNEKIDLKSLETLIKRYSLTKEGVFKEYWINNVEIIKKIEDIISYNYVNDLSINYDKENSMIVREYNCEKCIGFVFYDVDSEEEYIKYNSVINNINVILKCYDKYLTLEFLCDLKNDLYSNMHLVK